ncbi:MAG: PAS domain S-box protein [Candidatus Marinimicrobia bacterium]|nr:PAS domain S-box protein [Candidatus Neomarinimicrobiota bacterium]
MEKTDQNLLLAEVQSLREKNQQLEMQYDCSMKTAEILCNKFDQFVNILPQAVFEMDEEGNFEFLNPQGHVFFGYDKNEISTRLKFWQLFDPSERQRLWKNVHDVIHGKCNITGNEYTAVRKNGSKFYTLIYSCPVHNSAPAKLHGLILDIDKRKEVENELESSRDQLRDLSIHLQTVREEERAFLAREIHDELGQALTALKMDLLWIDKRLPKENYEITEKTKSMVTLLDSTIQVVKKICSDLRPGLLDDLGLKAAIEWYTEEFIDRTGIICKLNIDFDELVIDKHLAISIFRIFQETLTNVARHSRASRVQADFQLKPQVLTMKIQDNGIGISEEQIHDPKSLGLLGLRERVYPWGGILQIQGARNKGTIVFVEIPMKAGVK